MPLSWGNLREAAANTARIPLPLVGRGQGWGSLHADRQPHTAPAHQPRMARPPPLPPPHKGEGFPAVFPSISGDTGNTIGRSRARLWTATVLVAIAALTLVLLAGWLLSSWLDLGAAPPPKNPFGVGVREGGAPAGGIAGWILATQGEFYRRLTAAVRAMAADGTAAWTLASLSFAYGVFHAAGPGHGKAVVAAWMLANERIAAAGPRRSRRSPPRCCRAVVAVALVSVLAGLVADTTARGMTETVSAVETASFAAVALVGAVLLWTKARRFALRCVPQVAHAHAPGEACGPDCLHAHMPAPIADNSFSWRAAASAVFAAGLRPCSGAIIVLVFALAQGVFCRSGVAADLRHGRWARRSPPARSPRSPSSPNQRPCASPAGEGRPAHASSARSRCWPQPWCWPSARRFSPGSGPPARRG